MSRQEGEGSYLSFTCKPLPPTVIILIFVGAALNGQSLTPGVLIKTAINERSLVRLWGNTRPEATQTNDRGPVADDFLLSHLTLQLRRSAQQQAALDQYTADLQNPNSPDFHKWLTADAFGARYGAASGDIATITGWLQRHGLQVNVVFPSHTLVDFTGTAGKCARHSIRRFIIWWLMASRMWRI